MSMLTRLADVAGAVREDVMTAKAHRRARGMTTVALLEWADTAIGGIGQSLMDFRRGEDTGLDDAVLATKTYLVVLEELVERRAVIRAESQ